MTCWPQAGPSRERSSSCDSSRERSSRSRSSSSWWRSRDATSSRATTSLHSYRHSLPATGGGPLTAAPLLPEIRLADQPSAESARAFFQRDRLMSAYALADIDAAEIEKARWWTEV